MKEWAAVYVTTYMHLLSLAFAASFPFIHAFLRWLRGETPPFIREIVSVDVATGVAFPIFIGLSLASFLDDLNSIDKHVLVLGGCLGVAQIIMDLCTRDGPFRNTPPEE